MDQWNGQQRAVAIKFCWISSVFVGPFKSFRFFCVTLYLSERVGVCWRDTYLEVAVFEICAVRWKCVGFSFCVVQMHTQWNLGSRT
jgi:hypothetical protein